MIAHADGSLLEQFSNFTLVYNSPLLDGVRLLAAAMAGTTSALLFRLYTTHRTGRMNRLAGIGATATYFVVAWAQIVAISNPNNDLTLLNIAVTVAVACSLAGTIQAMDSTLFKKTQEHK